MRVLVAAALLAVAAACNVAESPQLEEAQAAEDAQVRAACEQFKREVGGRVDSPEEFGRVFDQMARDAGAPESFRDSVRDMWGDRPPNPQADPEQFKREMDKLADKCEGVGVSLE